MVGSRLHDPHRHDLALQGGEIPFEVGNPAVGYPALDSGRVFEVHVLHQHLHFPSHEALAPLEGMLGGQAIDFLQALLLHLLRQLMIPMRRRSVRARAVSSSVDLLKLYLSHQIQCALEDL